ncbi:MULTISPECIES: hypothetical protein [Halorussus]|uniref:hypothetical protein n=1 Tax=Halorussus TaxID=1070314 RepID=UPI000E21060D|nr:MULTISPECIES: hypothetical protein [Halorussus]NHN58724.1 hypothetical protein [Halorussus sp. JP-T4]
MTDVSISLPKWQVRSTIAILVLSVVATLVGLLRPGHYRDAAITLPQLYGQDAVTLGFAVPLLAVGTWYAARGSLRGYVVWLGALGYMLYTWASYALMLYFNELFLAYVALFGLSLFAFVGGVIRLDPTDVRDGLGGRLPVRLTAGFLAAIALFFAAGWLSEIVPATLAGRAPEGVRLAAVPANVIHVLDLAVLLPGTLLTAVWLRRDRAWGYALAGVLLVKFAALGLAVLAMAAWLRATGQGGGLGEMALFGFVTAVSLALGAAYLRAMSPRSGSGEVRTETATE